MFNTLSTSWLIKFQRVQSLLIPGQNFPRASGISLLPPSLPYSHAPMYHPCSRSFLFAFWNNLLWNLMYASPRGVVFIWTQRNGRPSINVTPAMKAVPADSSRCLFAFVYTACKRVSISAHASGVRKRWRGGKGRESPQGPTQAAQAYPKGAEIMEGFYRYN